MSPTLAPSSFMPETSECLGVLCNSVEDQRNGKSRLPKAVSWTYALIRKGCCARAFYSVKRRSNSYTEPAKNGVLGSL